VRGPRLGALLADGRLDEAATAVTAARRAAGDDADRRLARAFDLVLHQFRVDRARARWQQAAVAGDAQEARAAQEDLAGAVDGLGTLARAGERDTAAWQAWISGLVASGRADEATRAIAEARRADPEWAALPLLRAQALLANADEAGAETALRDALATDPDSGAALALARFLSTREREDEALDLLEAEAARGGDASLRASVLHERARLLLDAERSEAATQAIDAFAALRGEEDPATALLRARLTLLEGDAGDAAQQLMRLAPRLDSAATQYWLARALEVSGDLRGAERRYGLATIRAPSEPGAYAAIARLARQRGAWREAAAAGQQLVLRAPAAIDGWETLVDALLQLGELDAARETAQRCGELLIDTPEPLLLQARVSRAAGRGDEAQARLDQARERFGDSPQIRTEQVLLLSARRRGREALEAAERALAAPDLDALERSDLLHAKAISLFASRRFDAGAAAVDAALDAAPADLRPLRTRCQVAVSTGRLAVARLDCGRYVAAHPDDAGAHFAYGVALDQSDQAEAAVRAYERAAELDPHAAAPRNNLAHLRRQAGDLPGALQAAQQAYALAPDDAQVLDTLGELYLLEGLVGRARALLERAHELAPDDEAIARHLAVARSQHAADPAELSEP
jgi:tetratricopeptide (TPR) repeat protein